MGHLKKDVKITFLDDTPNSSNVSKILKETKKKISNRGRLRSNFCLDNAYVLKNPLNIYKYLTVNLVIIVNLPKVVVGTHKFQILNSPLISNIRATHQAGRIIRLFSRLCSVPEILLNF